MSRLSPGTWVRVWAQVTESRCHPDDVPLDLFSHNEQYEVVVTRERIESDGTEPPFARTCTALYRTTFGGYLWPCTRTENHHGKHLANEGQLSWSDADECHAGYLDPKPS